MRTFLLIILISFLPAVSFAQNTTTDKNATKQQLKQLERAWLDTYEENDEKAMHRILADGFTITGVAGRMRTKQDVIKNLNRDQPNDPSNRMYTTDSVVRLFGSNTAVITGTVVTETNGKITSKRRYTDTYVKIDGHWQVAASSLSLHKWYGK